MTDIRWKQRFNNYVKTWRLLQEICITEGKPTARDVLAMVQAYEMLSELGWKVMRDYLKHHALSNSSRPFEIIRKSFNEGFITDAQVWIDIIEARNLTSHTYNEAVAEKLTNDIRFKFVFAFEAFANQFTQYANEED